MMLQPFPSFEGWPEGSDERKFDSGPDGKGINAGGQLLEVAGGLCSGKVSWQYEVCAYKYCTINYGCILSCNRKICIVLIYSSFIHKRRLIPSTKPLSTLCGPSTLSILPLATGQSSLRP